MMNQVTERNDLRGMLKRIGALCDRNVKTINQRIQTRTKLDQLDLLLDRGERANALYQRVLARYEATAPQWVRDMWGDHANQKS